MCDFLESEYLKEQVEAIKEISDHITNLKRVGSGLGEYIYDKESMNDDDWFAPEQSWKSWWKNSTNPNHGIWYTMIRKYNSMC